LSNLEISTDGYHVESQSAPISIDEFIKLIDEGVDIPQVTISRTETRSKAQYSPNQYFLSVQMNFRDLWEMTKLCTDTKKARSLAKKKIHDEVMKKEQWVSSVLLHLQMKDEVPVFPRNPDNPALKATNLKQAIDLSREP
jgi:hypothetical protein